jgi:hypothetical protein
MKKGKEKRAILKEILKKIYLMTKNLKKIKIVKNNQMITNKKMIKKKKFNKSQKVK